MFEEVSEMLVEQLNRKYRELAREKYNASLASSLQNKKGPMETSLTRSTRHHHQAGEKAVTEFNKEEHRAASFGKYLIQRLLHRHSQ